MPQFLVIAHDGTDADAPARRQAVRAAHFERLKPAVDSGALVCAGAVLDDAGTMIGSAFMAEFPDRAALDAWIAEDPYTQHGVWQRIEVHPFRFAVRNGQVSP